MFTFLTEDSQEEMEERLMLLKEAINDAIRTTEQGNGHSSMDMV